MSDWAGEWHAKQQAAEDGRISVEDLDMYQYGMVVAAPFTQSYVGRVVQMRRAELEVVGSPEHYTLELRHLYVRPLESGEEVAIKFYPRPKW